jgi:hypothetical protein
MFNTREIKRKHVGTRFTQICGNIIHGDVNSSSRIGTLPSYYLQRLAKCPVELSCWFQIELSTPEDKINNIRFVGIKVRAIGNWAL